MRGGRPDLTIKSLPSILMIAVSHEFQALRPSPGCVPRPEFGRHAGLVNRELEREVAVLEQTATVRPLGFGGFVSMAMIVVTMVMMIVRPLGEPGRSGQSRQENE